MNIQRFTATGFNPDNRCAEVVADDHGAWVLYDDVVEMQRGADVDWQKCQEVHDKAKLAGVGYALHYAEADDSWYFTVSSAAPSEEWIGKNGGFDVAVARVIEWLDRVLAPRHRIERIVRCRRSQVSTINDARYVVAMLTAICETDTSRDRERALSAARGVLAALETAPQWLGQNIANDEWMEGKTFALVDVTPNTELSGARSASAGMQS